MTQAEQRITEEHVLLLETRLVDLGYAPGTTQQHLSRLTRLNVFLDERGLSVTDLRAEVLEEFTATIPWARPPTARSMCWLVEGLQQLGVTMTPVNRPVTAEQTVIDSYARYLVAERGLSASTVENYSRVVARFLGSHPAAELSRLTAADVARFVTSQCDELPPAAMKRMVTALRSFLTFALVEGLIGSSLSHAVPAVAHWRATGLPLGLTAPQTTRLLAVVDGSALSRRDRAMLLLLIRLGLRADEVAALGLDDIDWSVGELVLRGKARREDRLPLPPDVGTAIADYLRHDRPHRPERAVFLRSRAPLRALSADGVSQRVRTLSHRAGLGRVGAHRLRHTAGTQMLQAGATLVEVAEVLRHRSTTTTQIYAKVDHHALATLTVPWPGSTR